MSAPEATTSVSCSTPADGHAVSDAALPQAQVVARERLSWVWLLPLLALALGIWLAYKTLAERGPTIAIEFKAAAGLQAGKTRVKFKDVDIGQVSAIRVGAELDRVIVTAELTRDAEPYLTDRTRFWVERPRVTVGQISGLETLLSGAHIAIDPVLDGRPARDFVGLDAPPLITAAEPGSAFVLRAASLGSLTLGSPVYHRQIQVGQITDYRLDPDGGAVSVWLFIKAPYDRLVRTGTRFWNASGFEVQLTVEGLALNSESLLAMLIGGVAFDIPATLDAPGAPAPPGQYFPLYPSREEAHARRYFDKQRLVLRFNGSVRGLAVNAPVLLRGIQVGKVLDIQLQLDDTQMDFEIPVLVEIEPERIGTPDAARRANSIAVLERLVANGLRGQLRTASLLTGQLYIDLDLHPEAPPATLARVGDYPVLPTIPTPLAGLTATLDRVLARIENIPFEDIGRETQATLAALRALLQAPELTAVLTEAETALRQIGAAAARLDQETLAAWVAAAHRARALFEQANAVLQPEAPLTAEATRALRELGAAARSLRVLAETLERHPEALIKGKGGLR